MQTKLLIGAIAVIALGVIGVALLQHPAPQPFGNSAVQTDTVGDTGTTSQDTSAVAAKSYTLAVVAAHNSAASCWVAINSNVYDLTNWINQHPGGPQRILNICGTDATAAFTAQHGGQSRPQSELATFYLAPLSR